LNYAVANGVASNNSWGGGGFSSALQTAIQTPRTRACLSLPRATTASTTTSIRFIRPATTFERRFGRSDRRGDALAYFSNFGVKSVDLTAPGVGIYSTFPTHDAGDAGRGFSTHYETISGTSMATPHVTGVIALSGALHPTEYEQIIEQVLSTVDQVWRQTVSGGRLNAAAAVGNARRHAGPPSALRPAGVSMARSATCGSGSTRRSIRRRSAQTSSA
jgi:subtilisin family serine protease